MVKFQELKESLLSQVLGGTHHKRGGGKYHYYGNGVYWMAEGWTICASFGVNND